MSSWSQLVRSVTIGIACLCALASAQAGPVVINNNTPATAYSLTTGQLIVSDSLNGNVGRPATILGQFEDSRYLTLLSSNTNGSPLGNGFASQLVGVPLRFNGSAYFSVTGAPDATFIGAHTQTGLYTYQFDVFDAQHNLIESIAPEFENVSAGMIDNIWLDPSADPRRVGGTVDVTINNLVGPGTGNSRDFWIFSGLAPFQDFTAKIDASTFAVMIGQFNGANALVTKSLSNDPTATISGKADALGRVKIGVTGVPDTGFIGQHALTGTYTLELLPVSVPEPSTAALAIIGGAVGLWWRMRRRGR